MAGASVCATLTAIDSKSASVTLYKSRNVTRYHIRTPLESLKCFALVQVEQSEVC